MEIGEVARIQDTGRMCCEQCYEYIFGELKCPNCGKLGISEYAREPEEIETCRFCSAVFKELDDETEKWERVE